MMKRHQTCWQWLPRLFTSAGAYSNYLVNVHSEKDTRIVKDPQSRKGRLSNVREPEASPEGLDISIVELFITPDYYPESEPVSEGSGKLAREFSVDEESARKTQQTHSTNLISFTHAGQPLRLYLFSGQDAGCD